MKVKNNWQLDDDFFYQSWKYLPGPFVRSAPPLILPELSSSFLKIMTAPVPVESFGSKDRFFSIRKEQWIWYHFGVACSLYPERRMIRSLYMQTTLVALGC